VSLYITSDLGLAGWLLIQDDSGQSRLSMEDAQRLDDGKFRLVFSDPHARGPALAIEYLTSESAQHDQQVRNLKSLLHNRRSHGDTVETRTPGPRICSRR